MKLRFSLVRLSFRGGMFYCLDSDTKKRVSLHTKDEAAAKALVEAKNEALRNPMLNLQMARVYLAGSDPAMSTRTWQHVMDSMVVSKPDGSETKRRWEVAIKQRAFDLIREKLLLETKPEDLTAALKAGTVSTNTHLRKLQNYAIGMGWLPWPILAKNLFPKVRHKAKRAITLQEHKDIVAKETNPERRAFYELCWYLGGSQGDIAKLTAEDVDWSDQTICYDRQKLAGMDDTDLKPPLIRFSESCAAVLRSLPSAGPLFPYLRTVRACDRATEFKQRCSGLAIQGITLHCYRYSWAERARKAGYPERFAQEALGHNSKAVHRAYAKKAAVKIPSLEDWENKAEQDKIIQLGRHENPTQEKLISDAAS